MSSLSIDFDVPDTVDLFGKVASNLQQGVSLNTAGTGIEGTLKYVEEYTGFSSDPELQEGNYIVFHVDVPGVDGVTYTATMDNTSTLDSDQIAIFRVRDKSSQTLTIVASKEGYNSVTKTYGLSDLYCKAKDED